jgi:hypothetical protein
MPLDPAHFVSYATLNADEQARIDDCFVSGAFAAGTYFVVFSRNPDLYHILGVYPVEDDAVRALAAGPAASLKWTARDKAAIKYTSATARAASTVVSTPFTANSLFAVAHPCWTESSICELTAGASALRRHPSQDDITEIELRIKVKGSRTTIVYTVDPKADAIFLTQGAWDLFAAPHYRAAFGNKFLAAMRQYLSEGVTSMIEAAPDR